MAKNQSQMMTYADIVKKHQQQPHITKTKNTKIKEIEHTVTLMKQSLSWL